MLFAGVVMACLAANGLGSAMQHVQAPTPARPLSPLSAALLSVNWLIYIWSVNHGHVVDASLGYFMTPLVNVAARHHACSKRAPATRAALSRLLLAAAGVVWLTVGAGRLPWIGLVLGLSFGGYGLLRKVAALGALEGLTLETLLLAPFAIAAMAWWWGSSAASFPAPTLGANLWLIGLGPLTSVPLLLFASGARRLPLTTLGLMQYIAPTIQLVLGVWLFAEPFTTDRAVGFALIWLALALYTVDTWRTARRSTAVVAGRDLKRLLDCVAQWGGSSAGRASRSQCEGREFDPPPLHHLIRSSRISESPPHRRSQNSSRCLRNQR